MAIEAAKWSDALEMLGFTTYTVAGGGPVDVTVPGLAIDALEGPGAGEVSDAVAGADLVVVENLCSLPLNQRAWDVVAATLAGRPAILHHHDLPWQRPQFLGHAPPPDDRRWRHVTINQISQRELAERGIEATTIYNSFAMESAAEAMDAVGGHRNPAVARSRGGDEIRDALGITRERRLVLQPTRALARKNVGAGMDAAAQLGATFWLLGPAEDGYGPELERLVADAPCPVVLGAPDMSAVSGVVGPGGRIRIDDAYQACDVVALPSTWEGFGNPSLESVTHRRPLIIGPYPVAEELASFGFDWFSLGDMDRLDQWLVSPDPALLDQNLAVARAHFALDDLPGRIAGILPEL